MKFNIKHLHSSLVETSFLEAHDYLSACELAESQGLRVLSVKPVNTSIWTAISRFHTKHKFNLELFNHELLILLESGLSLVEAIEALADRDSNQETENILRRIISCLYEGNQFSTCLEKAPEVFSQLYIALIRASERNGNIPEALRRHLAYQAQVSQVRKKIISASIYPMLLLIVGGMVVIFLLGYVVPKFSSVYETSGKELPWASKLLLLWGQLLQLHGIEVMLGFLTLIIFGVLMMMRTEFQEWLSRNLLKVPAIGEFVRIYQLAIFNRALGMLLKSGVPLVKGMEMTLELLPRNLRFALHKVIHEVRNGRSFSESMHFHGMTTSISLRMLRVGEKGGQLDQMLERIGIFHDEEIARKVEWFSKLLEPTLMLLIGLVVGLVVVLMYMPIFELAGEVQ